MVCEVKDNAIKHLEKEKAINAERTIIDTVKFNNLVKNITNLAITKYGLETNGELLFQDTEIKLRDKKTSTYKRDSFITINTAEPNDELFENTEWISKPKFSGYAVGYGIETIVGPVEVKYTWTPELSKGYVLFTIGFWF